MSADDLSGSWHGFYNYPNGRASVAFDAVIRDVAGALTGTIREIEADYGPPRMLESILDGIRSAQTVRFTKFYENDGDGDFDTVLYDGEIRDEGREIQGRWDIPGEWSGSFVMVRQAGKAAAIERAIAETVR